MVAVVTGSPRGLTCAYKHIAHEYHTHTHTLTHTLAYACMKDA